MSTEFKLKLSLEAPAGSRQITVLNLIQRIVNESKVYNLFLNDLNEEEHTMIVYYKEE